MAGAAGWSGTPTSSTFQLPTSSTFQLPTTWTLDLPLLDTLKLLGPTYCMHYPPPSAGGLNLPPLQSTGADGQNRAGSSRRTSSKVSFIRERRSVLEGAWDEVSDSGGVSVLMMQVKNLLCPWLRSALDELKCWLKGRLIVLTHSRNTWCARYRAALPQLPPIDRPRL